MDTFLHCRAKFVYCWDLLTYWWTFQFLHYVESQILATMVLPHAIISHSLLSKGVYHGVYFYLPFTLSLSLSVYFGQLFIREWEQWIQVVLLVSHLFFRKALRFMILKISSCFRGNHCNSWSPMFGT